MVCLQLMWHAGIVLPVNEQLTDRNREKVSIFMRRERRAHA